MQLHPRLLPRKNFLPFSVDKYRIWAYTLFNQMPLS